MKPYKQWFGGGLLFSCLIGCAGAHGAAMSAGAISAKPLTVSLLTESATPGRVSTSYVLPHDTLHSGDQLAFKVEVSRLAYVYLIWYSQDGWSPILFPPAGDQPS